MTEAAHQISCNPLPPATRKPGSVGVPTGTDVAIFDEQGRSLGPDCEGEIVIRGGSVISSYFGYPSVDRQSFTGGWFRTGDCGSMDRDGYLFIKGRAQEIMNRGGTKIAPHEIEEVLLDHSNVGEAVVFAMPDTRLAAAIVLRDPRTSAETEIREFVSRQLSYFKVPRRLVFLDKIPKGPTGKPHRVGLGAELGSVELREAHRKDVHLDASRTDLEDVLATMWARIIGIERVSVDDNFFEIGGDSLAAMEVIAGTEQVTGTKAHDRCALRGTNYHAVRRSYRAVRLKRAVIRYPHPRQGIKTVVFLR
jgi:hypothetical protein